MNAEVTSLFDNLSLSYSGDHAWKKVVHSQTGRFPLLQSVPELKIVFTQEVGRNFRALQDVPSNLEENHTPDEATLRKLLHDNQLRAAFSLTTKILLNEAEQMNQRLHVWQTRLNLYIRFGAFNEAKLELEQFSQLEDLPIQFGQNSAHGGIPFTLLLTVAHLHLLCGAKDRAQAKLSKLLHQCQENIVFYREKANDAFVQLWKERELRVIAMLTNYGVEQNDLKFAISSLLQLRSKQTDPADLVKTESQLGKLFLQFGDLDTAENHFKEAARFCKGDLDDQLQQLLNKALLAIANGDYQAANAAYEEGSKLQPDNITFINNRVVCALYLGRSSDGVQLLEEAFAANPAAAINECTIGNICALYRLQSHGEAKKEAIRQMVAKYGRETFNCQVLDTEV
ncbi:hypothetical protein BIW11_09968 [Tropilaelaps mercedesae]|uniref:Uncharacterized protein n=1 Tax=Tropilaelaps mercedesae TaxID=418985 RepID=A0A1V9XHV7_9ACAR|nr:hypothetical protein BIW11_09968 [Tropilaelaps mercedesae]